MYDSRQELADDDNGDDNGDDDEGYIDITDSMTYLGPLVRILAMLHTFFAFGMIVAYYCLKVCIS